MIHKQLNPAVWRNLRYGDSLQVFPALPSKLFKGQLYWLHSFSRFTWKQPEFGVQKLWHPQLYNASRVEWTGTNICIASLAWTRLVDNANNPKWYNFLSLWDPNHSVYIPDVTSEMSLIQFCFLSSFLHLNSKISKDCFPFPCAPYSLLRVLHVVDMQWS